MNKLIFKLSESEFIKVIEKNNIDFKKVDYCCSEIRAYFINEQQLRVGQESANDFFEAFIKVLKYTIDNKLQLHESLTQNLGLMYNEYFHDLPYKNPKFIMMSRSDGSSRYWVGYNYKIWETSNDANPYVTTWLYNDYEGNIIFEVTPFYKWSMQEREPEDLDFITYDGFIKNYKPLIHRVIPRDVAIEWLGQAMKIYRGFFKNEKDYIRACKENNW